ncbi:hypothetical protein BRC77_03970 [Halobacteriales archaeon QH_8_64_26]|nr:MAG: hypothetical protein BRC77_03970 [Halobacteriales archaeon QH_8_64_26]
MLIKVLPLFGISEAIDYSDIEASCPVEFDVVGFVRFPSKNMDVFISDLFYRYRISVPKITNPINRYLHIQLFFN